MKKLFWTCLTVYGIYCLLIILYIVNAEAVFPQHLVGTKADPTTFMTAEQVRLSEKLSAWRNIIYFINQPFEWLIYLFVMCFGLSQLFRKWVNSVTRFRVLRTSVYILLLSTFSWIVTFPISYFSYWISKDFGISVQIFSSWMRDQLISFWVNAIIFMIIGYVLMLLIDRSEKRWWLYAWALSIPFTLLLMFIQPVVIDPLYNEFRPIQNKELEREILNLAAKANIPADNVHEVEMSDKTNAMNAYVNGIGRNLQIVLWDTTLDRLEMDEVLFIMAHEMGHYVLKHLPLLLFGTIALSFFALYVTYRLYHWAVNRFGDKLQIKRNDLAALPLILLILSLLSFASTPFTNVISRIYEYQADEYAVDLTNDTDAAISTFQKLSVESLSEVNPPTLVKIFRYTHPPMVDRITHIKQYGEN